MKAKENLSNIEILGAQQVFKDSLLEHNGDCYFEELFYCGGLLNSTSDANGRPQYIYGLPFSHCELLENHVLLAVCYDEAEEKVYYRCDNDGFCKVEV